MTEVRKRLAIAVAAILLAMAWSLPAAAQQAAPLTPAQEKAVEELIERYILDHPEVIVDAVRKMRERQEREQRERARANLVAMREKLVADPLSPVAGNPDGDVTIVEFFDCRCGFYKRVFPAIIELLQTDAKVRWVFKEFPILGEESTFAARAALSAFLIAPERYQDFHNALMQTNGSLPESRVMKIAAHVGLDVNALRRGMDDPRIGRIIHDNMVLAQSLGINGTPAFVVGDELVPGAVDLAALRRLVAQARGS